MKLKIQYENKKQTIELNAEDTNKLWVSLSLEGEGLSDKQKESMIQEEWNEQFNKPDYNNWHTNTRYIGNYVGQGFDGEKIDSREAAWVDPLMGEVRDTRIFLKEANQIEMNMDYEEVCDWIRKTLGKHENWADAFIAVHMDGISVNDYAAGIGKSPSSVSHFLERARKKLAENYAERQI